MRELRTREVQSERQMNKAKPNMIEVGEDGDEVSHLNIHYLSF